MLACAAIRHTGFMFGCFVPPVSAAGLASQDTCIHLLGGATPTLSPADTGDLWQCSLGVEVKGGLVGRDEGFIFRGKEDYRVKRQLREEHV